MSSKDMKVVLLKLNKRPDRALIADIRDQNGVKRMEPEPSKPFAACWIRVYVELGSDPEVVKKSVVALVATHKRRIVDTFATLPASDLSQTKKK